MKPSLRDSGVRPYVVIAVLAALAVSTAGYVMNALWVLHNIPVQWDALTPRFVIHAVGVFVPPIGCAFGWLTP